MNYQTDPLNERAHEVLPGLIWKYSNRALVLLTHQCPSGCAFCFRANLYTTTSQRATNQEIIEFIKQQPEIREIIFSGGEPLLCPDDLREIIEGLRNFHIKRFRIHTRLPITFPANVDINLLTSLPHLLEQPLYLTLHVNHPRELLNQDVRFTIQELRKAGYILLSHTVFLNGVNNTVDTLAELFENLADLGVKPYYIFHCDHMEHTARFEVPLYEERQIMTALRKTLSGIAYPLHVIDSASGKGKIPVPTLHWTTIDTEYTDFEGGTNYPQ